MQKKRASTSCNSQTKEAEADTQTMDSPFSLKHLPFSAVKVKKNQPKPEKPNWRNALKRRPRQRGSLFMWWGIKFTECVTSAAAIWSFICFLAIRTFLFSLISSSHLLPPSFYPSLPLLAWFFLPPFFSLSPPHPFFSFLASPGILTYITPSFHLRNDLKWPFAWH